MVGVVCRQGPDRSKGFFAGLADLIAEAIDDAPAFSERLMQVARLLWKPPRPRTGRRTPFVADVHPDLRLPQSVQAWVDQSEPLATAPIGWRMVTLLGAAKLLDLAGSRESLGQLTFTLDQMVDWTEERDPSRRMAHCAPVPPTQNRLSLRPEAEYLELAKAILASDEWRAAQAGDPRAQRRTLGALIDKALAEPQRPSSAPSAVVSGALEIPTPIND